MNHDLTELFYFRIADLWKRLCEEHTLLFDLTCDEYSLLLSSDVENLEDKIADKQVVINKITGLEKMRGEIILEMKNDHALDFKNISDLLSFFNKFEDKMSHRHLFGFNAILIDIIEKIQHQNKRNQVFINKAILSLKSIREEAYGVKAYSTYNSKGSSHSRNINV